MSKKILDELKKMSKIVDDMSPEDLTKLFNESGLNSKNKNSFSQIENQILSESFKEIETKVAEFVKSKHKNLYDGKPYLFHINMVVNIAKSNLDPRIGNWDREIIILSAYMHDLLEDTDATEDEIRSLTSDYGDFVLDSVKALTDKPGKNRFERHLKTYHIIRKTNTAIAVKICDRLANVLYSRVSLNEKKLNMYKKEAKSFKLALYDESPILQNLWDTYDKILEIN